MGCTRVLSTESCTGGQIIGKLQTQTLHFILLNMRLSVIIEFRMSPSYSPFISPRILTKISGFPSFSNPISMRSSSPFLPRFVYRRRTRQFENSPNQLRRTSPSCMVTSCCAKLEATSTQVKEGMMRISSLKRRIVLPNFGGVRGYVYVIPFGNSFQEHHSVGCERCI